MILTTDEFCQKIIASECKPQIKFISSKTEETQLGFVVYAASEELQQKIISNWNDPAHLGNFICRPKIIRDDLWMRGINVPTDGGYVPMPQYVIGFDEKGFNSLPLEVVILIAKVYQEIITQADAFKGCPREELARSVTHSLVTVAEEMKLKCRHDIYIHVEEDLRGYTVKLHKYSVHVEYHSLIMSVIFNGHYSSRTVHSLNPILTDLFGLKNA